MPTRNTPVLQEIIDVLGDQLSAPAEALTRLEEHFGSDLLLVAGTTTQVAENAEILRLAITTDEAALVLDHIGQTGSAKLSIEQTEDVVNALFEDRFIEPGP